MLALPSSKQPLVYQNSNAHLVNGLSYLDADIGEHYKEQAKRLV
jgi:hypothetical protein